MLLPGVGWGCNGRVPLTTECRECGTTVTYYPSTPRQFCSIACRTAYRRRAGAWEVRVCENCGKTFAIAGGRIAEGGGRFCSDECRVELKAVPEKTCPVCGRKFWTRHASSVYCSKTCGGLARQTRVRRRCPTCGVLYEAEPGRLAQGKDWHCSKACAFPGPVDRQCEKCGCAFSATRSEIAKGWGRFCSNECRRTRSGVLCATCGEPFEATPSKLADGAGKYCSVECRGLAMRDRVKRECVVCGKGFEVPASAAARTAAKFCSRACNTVARAADPVEVERVRKMQHAQLLRRGPTRPERILYSLMDDVAGEGAWAREYLVFDKWTVDACIPERRLIVQADGDYWHGLRPEWQAVPRVAANMANDRRQNAYVAKTEWTMIRLWETDLINRPDWCRDLIRQSLPS